MSIREVFIAALLSAAVVGGTAIAATQHDHGATPPTAAAPQAPAMDHQKMMADIKAEQAKLADIKAEQAKLDELVAQMNAATGPGKVDQIAAVVNEMAAMHKRMSSMMMMMQGGMMQGQMKMPGKQTP
jgi:hypothetical protein